MKEQNVILEKSYQFALRTIKLFMLLKKQQVERTLLVQLLKAGTSIGANTEEAVGAQTKKDFITKLSIAYKEAREAHYWLRLLRDASLLEPKLAASFLADAEELKKILAAILKTAKSSRS
ncbi:MAG: four helix bundle protein [Flavisolibacter sp.]